MSNIEQELHSLLLELAPNCYNHRDQSLIIAEATANFYKIERLANKTSNNKKDLKESRMIEAVLEAINVVSDNVQDYDDEDIIHGEYMSPEQIIHKASKMKPRNISTPFNTKYSKPFGDMVMLNDDDLDPFFFNDTETQTAEHYLIDDTFPTHPIDVHFNPSLGRHKSDSQNRN
jgi:hypothetical protein